MTIKNVKTNEDFDFLYNHSALTWEGIDEGSFEWALAICGTNDSVAYLIKGRDMNTQYNLSGNLAYPDELNILAIYPTKKLHYMYEAKWFDDIVDSNK